MQPQTCTKCHSLPQDILMLACSHDLCLSCASDRLAFEMKKKKPANSIVCQFCYQRTPLDSQSVAQLEKIITSKSKKASNDDLNRRSQIKTYQKPYQKSNRQPQKKDKFSYDHGIDKGNNDIVSKHYDRTKQKSYQRLNPKQSGISYTGQSNIVSSKKSCNQHPQQQILYFCFDCKCQCICPQCVIHGKHKDHQVKTIKKAHPVVKSQLQKNIQKFQNNIQGLLIKKSQVEKNIRTLNQQNNQSKRQIQQAFQQIRLKLDQKQKQILKTCQQSLQQGLQQLQKYVRNVIKRIDQIKHHCSTTQQFLKRDQLTSLNYYARKWKQLSQQAKQTDVTIGVINFPSNQIILASILDLTDQIGQIGLSSSVPSRGSGKY